MWQDVCFGKEHAEDVTTINGVPVDGATTIIGRRVRVALIEQDNDNCALVLVGIAGLDTRNPGGQKTVDLCNSTRIGWVRARVVPDIEHVRNDPVEPAIGTVGQVRLKGGEAAATTRCRRCIRDYRTSKCIDAGIAVVPGRSMVLNV
jgi:hypothetical protein